MKILNAIIKTKKKNPDAALTNIDDIIMCFGLIGIYCAAEYSPGAFNSENTKNVIKGIRFKISSPRNNRYLVCFCGRSENGYFVDRPIRIGTKITATK